MYREASSFIDDECLLSERADDSGDPLAMVMYMLSPLHVPLLQKLDGIANQTWFADNAATAATAGFLADLLACWMQEAVIYVCLGSWLWILCVSLFIVHPLFED